MRKFNTISFLIVLIFAACCIAAGTEQNYFAVIIDGKKVGHSVTARQVKDGKIYTSQQLTMTVSRFGTTITASTEEICIETTDGKPLGFETKMNANRSLSGSKGTIIDDGKMEVYVYVGGLGQTQIMEYPEGAVMAEGVRQMQLKRGLKENDSFTVLSFVPSMLKAGQTEIKTFGSEQIDLFGRIVTATKQTATMNIDGQIIPMTEYVNEEMEVYKATSAAMGMNMELIACDKAIAISDNDIYDLLDKTLVKCPVTLPDRKTLKSVTYYLTPSPDRTVDIPEDDNQKISEQDGIIAVTVKPVRNIKKTHIGYKGEDAEIIDALKPTPYVQSDDKLIVKLAEEATGKAEDAETAAKNIEKFVGDYITEKSMSVGYASAVEVAKSKQGDCSEHAVLTAALLRAAGIPARVAVGLVYVESIGDKTDVLGGHAWTEGYIGGKWIGLDATRGYGAGHIKLSSGNGDPTGFMEMIGSFGNFTITKVEFER